MSNEQGKGKLGLPEEDWRALPTPVKRQPNWGVYDTKGNKRPTSVITGHSKGWNLPENWTSFREAADFCEANLDHLPGFFFSTNNRIVGVDLDSCRNPETGELERWALEIIDACDTYTEISLSGTGVKLLGASDSWEQGKSKIVRTLKGMPQYGNHTPQIDLRFTSSFFGLTGRVIRQGFQEIGNVVLPLADEFLAHQEAERTKKWKKKRHASQTRTKKRTDGKARRGTKALIDEFNRIVSIANVIEAFGWAQVGPNSFRRPGKRGDGHSATTRIGNDGVERIAFWTTEAEPFETSEADFEASEYSAFDCWLLLRFDGDFGSAIQAWKSRLTTLLKKRRRAK